MPEVLSAHYTTLDEFPNDASSFVANMFRLDPPNEIYARHALILVVVRFGFVAMNLVNCELDRQQRERRIVLVLAHVD